MLSKVLGKSSEKHLFAVKLYSVLWDQDERLEYNLRGYPQVWVMPLWDGACKHKYDAHSLGVRKTSLRRFSEKELQIQTGSDYKDCQTPYTLHISLYFGCAEWAHLQKAQAKMYKCCMNQLVSYTELSRSNLEHVGQKQHCCKVFSDTSLKSWQTIHQFFH